MQDVLEAAVDAAENGAGAFHDLRLVEQDAARGGFVPQDRGEQLTNAPSAISEALEKS